jgi:hypothetical protein
MAMATPEEQLGQILALLSENTKGINDLKSSMSEMRSLKTEILTRKPEVDNRVHELEHAVLDLGERVEHALGALLPQAQPMEPVLNEQAETVTTVHSPLTVAIREDHFASLSVKVSSFAHLELHPPRAASGLLGPRQVIFSPGCCFWGGVYRRPGTDPSHRCDTTSKIPTNISSFNWLCSR